MASVAGPNTTNPILEILKANGINPDMMVSREVTTVRGEEAVQMTAFAILEAAIGAALDEIEDGQKP